MEDRRERQRDGTPEDRARIKAATENSAGTITHDELGQPRWTWITELDTDLSPDDTFNYLKALDTDALTVADEPGAAPSERDPKQKQESGYDPYDTARIKIKGRFPNR